MTDEQFARYLLENLPNNVRGATIKLCDRFLQKYIRSAFSYEQSGLAFSIFKEFLEEHNVSYSMPESLKKTSSNDKVVKGIGAFFKNVQKDMQSLDSMEKFGNKPLSNSWQKNGEEVSTEKLEFLSHELLIEERKQENNKLFVLLSEALKSSIERPTYSFIKEGDIMTENRIDIHSEDSSVIDISGQINQMINQLPDNSNEQQEIKKLLAQLNDAITSEATLEKLDKEDALEEVKNLAEASKKSDEEGKKKGGKAIRTLQRIVTALPATTALVKACSELLPAIAKLLGL